MASLGLIAAIAAVTSFSLGDTAATVVTREYGNKIAALFGLGFSSLPLLVSLYFIPQNIFNFNSLIVGLVTGFLQAVGYVLVYKSLSTEQASNTWVFINIPAAALVMLGLFGLNERVDLLQILSMLLIFIGAFFVTLNENFKFNRKLLPAITGNICWALFAIILVYSVSSSSSESTSFYFVSKVFGFLMLLCYFVAGKKLTHDELKKLRKPNLMALASGLLDGFGQMGVTAYTLFRFVALGGAITAVEPIFVAVVGAMAFKDRLTKFQMFGLVVSVVAAVAINFV